MLVNVASVVSLHIIFSATFQYHYPVLLFGSTYQVLLSTHYCRMVDVVRV